MSYQQFAWKKWDFGGKSILMTRVTFVSSEKNNKNCKKESYSQTKLEATPYDTRMNKSHLKRKGPTN